MSARTHIPGLRSALICGRGEIAKGQAPHEHQLEHDGEEYVLRFERIGFRRQPFFGFVLRQLDATADGREASDAKRYPREGVEPYCIYCGCVEGDACARANAVAGVLEACGWVDEKKTVCTACFGNRLVRNYPEFSVGSVAANTWLAGRAALVQPAAVGGAR